MVDSAMLTAYFGGRLMGLSALGRRRPNQRGVGIRRIRALDHQSQANQAYLPGTDMWREPRQSIRAVRALPAIGHYCNLIAKALITVLLWSLRIPPSTTVKFYKSSFPQKPENLVRRRTCFPKSLRIYFDQDIFSIL